MLFDDNGISIDGPLTLVRLRSTRSTRFKAAGWNAARIDGHDPEAIAAAHRGGAEVGPPDADRLPTTIGYGAPKKAGTSKAHGEPLGAEEIAGAKAALGWTPRAVRGSGRRSSTTWREAGRRGAARRRAHGRRALAKRSPEASAPSSSAAWPAAAAGPGRRRSPALKEQLVAEPQDGRDAQGERDRARDDRPGDAGARSLGSADLTPSNNTKTKNLDDITPGTYSGRYIHYGIREHGMAAAMNGMALHGGLIPLPAHLPGLHRLCRPAIRLAALMGIRVIYVMTHDSIGLGEDGPTHQPVEHLAALRAMPNLRVFRPADAIETAECWQLALERTDGPTVLALTRQNLPPVRTRRTPSNLSRRGAYELLAGRRQGARSTLFASGSEVEIALAAQKLLDDAGHPRPRRLGALLELFLAQPEDYARASIVGDAPVKVAVEAAVRFGWDAVIGPDGIFVGMTSFGASARPTRTSTSISASPPRRSSRTRL